MQLPRRLYVLALVVWPVFRLSAVSPLRGLGVDWQVRRYRDCDRSVQLSKSGAPAASTADFCSVHLLRPTRFIEAAITSTNVVDTETHSKIVGRRCHYQH